MNYDTALHPLSRDVRFQRFVKRRSTFSWTLTAIIIAIYFGFIGIIAFRRDILAPLWPAASPRSGS